MEGLNPRVTSNVGRVNSIVLNSYRHCTNGLLTESSKTNYLRTSLSFCRGSRVEGCRSRARVPCRGSRVTFFFPIFFFFGKGNNRCIKKNKKNLKKQMAREHLVVVGWGEGGLGLE